MSQETQIDREALMDRAFEAAELSYSPYSHFRVGAALLCQDGTVVTAANIENRSFGMTICAERSAIVKAHSLGRTRYTALAVACPDAGYPVSPCGACRQVISEFAGPDFPVYFTGADRSQTVCTTIGSLFPYDALKELAQP
ncbi:MAG: cytidine deaminase [Spirochaetales bacterium]|jgi:cytidine deaminase|nr:cytidine deaminase [Spirochaetales bacterium]